MQAANQNPLAMLSNSLPRLPQRRHSRSASAPPDMTAVRAMKAGIEQQQQPSNRSRAPSEPAVLVPGPGNYVGALAPTSVDTAVLPFAPVVAKQHTEHAAKLRGWWSKIKSPRSSKRAQA